MLLTLAMLSCTIMLQIIAANNFVANYFVAKYFVANYFAVHADNALKYHHATNYFVVPKKRCSAKKNKDLKYHDAKHFFC